MKGDRHTARAATGSVVWSCDAPASEGDGHPPQRPSPTPARGRETAGGGLVPPKGRGERLPFGGTRLFALGRRAHLFFSTMCFSPPYTTHGSPPNHCPRRICRISQPEAFQFCTQGGSNATCVQSGLACAQFLHMPLSLRPSRQSRRTWLSAFLALWGPEQACLFHGRRQE